MGVLSGSGLPFSKRMTAFLLLGWFCFLQFPVAYGDLLTCESDNNRFKRCAANTRHGVSLATVYSKTACVKGKTWGVDTKGVWVTRGCRASFNIGTPTRVSEENNATSSGSWKKTAAIGAGVAALAAIGLAIANNKANSAPEPQDVQSSPNPYVPPINTAPAQTLPLPPQWAQGHFFGYDPIFQLNVDLMVQPNGMVSRTVQGQRDTGSWYSQGAVNQIVIGGYTFDVQPESNGFRTILREDPNNQVIYSRVNP